MKLKKTDRECSHRIALVIDNSSLKGSRLISGLCRRATAYPHLMVRRFFLNSLTDEGVDRLVDWEPDGLIVYFDDISLLQKLRKALPRTTVVAMNTVPRNLVDAIVAGNSNESADLCLDHFSRNGLTDFAMFYAGHEEAAISDANEFQRLLPNYPGTFDYFYLELSSEELLNIPEEEALEQINAWLQGLPKPVGIYCPTDHTAAYLVRVCNHYERAIPEDVQVIGCDELDESLECFPHITSIHLPSERIGAASLKKIISLLNGEIPEAKIQTVSGSSLIPQGSTGVIPSQLSDIPAAVAYIEAHATQSATVDDVLKQTQSVSRMTFYRDFKEETGDSPAHYIRCTRINAARQLLAATELDITRIAELSGFSCSNYFAQAFRRDVGMTPKQYRKSQPEKA